VVFQILDPGDVLEYIRIQIDVCQRSLTIFIICAQVDRSTSELTNLHFQVLHQQAPDSKPLVFRVNDQGVQLPGVPFIFPDGTDPAKN
jgi:hypothetical protein